MEDLMRSLPKLLRVIGESEEIAEAAAFAAWRNIAGPSLLNNAAPFRLYRKTLVVAVTDASWQKQLEAMSGQLIFRLNSALGQAMVTFLEFRVDHKTVKAERASMKGHEKKREGEPRAIRPAPGEVLAAAQSIRDPDLRDRFLLAAGSCLERN
jgi:hypothetical protein